MKKVKRKKKTKINKYTKRRLMAVLILIILFILIKFLTSGKKEDKIPDLTILFNNEFLTPKKEVIIDEGKNIYFSKDDIQAIFDEMIYYNYAEKELITTYNTHTALLKVDESNMLVNGNNVSLIGKMKEIKNVVYLPLNDLKEVYDIELQYLEKQNRIIIDSKLEEKKEANTLKNVNLKNKKGLFRKNIQKLKTGENVIVIGKEGNYAKVRTSLGKIGYIKSRKLTNERTIREKDKEFKFDLKFYKEYSNISGVYENFEAESDKLNLVSPTFFYIGKNSKILDKTTSTTATYANYTNWLKENDLSILPTLETNESVSSTLLTYSQRSRAINELYDKVTHYQYKGININFKNIDDINSFYRFIIELAPKFKESDLIICVTINDIINKEKILKITDYIIED